MKAFIIFGLITIALMITAEYCRNRDYKPAATVFEILSGICLIVLCGTVSIA